VSKAITVQASAAAVAADTSTLVAADAVLVLQVSPREYLETALSPTAGAGAAIEAKNQVRRWQESDANMCSRAQDPYWPCKMLGMQQQVVRCSRLCVVVSALASGIKHPVCVPAAAAAVLSADPCRYAAPSRRCSALLFRWLLCV
jgi:hypothetical protein